MRAGWNSAVIVAVAGVGAGLAGNYATARADVVVSHLPQPYGGSGGDSEFLWNGVPFWQFAADDFVLSHPATIRRVTWWSFYGMSDLDPIEPPPPTQTIRLRVYDSRPSDGLPGDVLFEEYFVDPWRELTGVEILWGPHPPEFRYQVDLMTPWSLNADNRYWFAVAQMGIPSSTYRWEFSWPPDGTGFAYINPLTGDWRPNSSVSNLAFTLSTVPEPQSTAILALSLALLTSLHRTRRIE